MHRLAEMIVELNDISDWNDDDLYEAAHEIAMEDAAESIRYTAREVHEELRLYVQMQKLSPADKAFLHIYPRFIEAVVNQLAERQKEMEMDLEPEDRVPFVNFVDTIGAAHFESMLEEMITDAVKLAEKLT